MVDHRELLNGSHKRFLRLLGQFQSQENANGEEINALLQTELRKSLESNQNNIALVVCQAWLAIYPLWNSSRILSRARVVPVEWIQFMAADDDYILLG